jgi:hypothetical protein
MVRNNGESTVDSPVSPRVILYQRGPGTVTETVGNGSERLFVEFGAGPAWPTRRPWADAANAVLALGAGHIGEADYAAFLRANASRAQG